MDIIEHNGHAYFVNGAKPIDEGYARFFGRKQPSEEVDYFLAKRKHFIFNPKHVKDFDDLGWILGFFDFQQPKEERVRQAMIWSIDDACPGDWAYNRYMIKSGGGSKSDSCFSSSFSVLTASETTGLDTWSVLVKKHSTRFDDVLITGEEISRLFEMSSTEPQRDKRDRQYAFDILKFLLSSLLCGKFHFSNSSPVAFTNQSMIGFINKCRPKAHEDHWKAAFEQCSAQIDNDRKRVPVEIAPSTNQQHQEQCSRRELALIELKTFFFTGKAPANLPMIKNATQMNLFASA